jgi:glycosyltransferase involved in cell wall biosynthesis
LEVLFAPDWRAGNPYQELLAKALRRHAVNVSFIEGYKRIFPLRRLLATQRCDVLHLHWPEAYYPRVNDGFDWFRYARFPLDLAGATSRCVLATTAHNFSLHSRRFLKSNIRHANAEADVVFAHSFIAKQRLIESLALASEKVRVIPHGDLSEVFERPIPAFEARRELGLDPGKLAVVFGRVEPYKGLEEIIEWWHQAQPNVKLAIIGEPCSHDYASQITRLIGHTNNVTHRLQWLSVELLRLWLSAANVTIFNYRNVFTSGAANLARSFGIPILIPRRLDTVILDEPTPYVRRFASFSTDFGEELAEALAVQSDFAAASSWRESCGWDEIARLTVDGYRYAIGCNRS